MSDIYHGQDLEIYSEDSDETRSIKLRQQEQRRGDILTRTAEKRWAGAKIQYVWVLIRTRIDDEGNFIKGPSQKNDGAYPSAKSALNVLRSFEETANEFNPVLIPEQLIYDAEHGDPEPVGRLGLSSEANFLGRPLTRAELQEVGDHIGLGIDPDILPLIIDLNEAGYQTKDSCSGDSPNHPFREQRHAQNACIVFDKGFTMEMLTEEALEDLDSIIRDHTNLPYKFDKGIYNRGASRYENLEIEFKGPIS